jgi:hypothetical protein
MLVIEIFKKIKTLLIIKKVHHGQGIQRMFYDDPKFVL